MHYSLFDDFVLDVLEKEGGYVDDPRDSGGETNYGITVAVARKNGYAGPMIDMPIETAKRIYRQIYWDSMMLDEIARLAPSVAMKLADIGVNLGVRRAGDFIQRTLNVMNNQGKYYPDMIVDGIIGRGTLENLRLFLKHRSRDGELVLVRALNCLQGSFYISLAERRHKDEAFVYGWLLNRIA
jgi:lysozyme family protein